MPKRLQQYVMGAGRLLFARERADGTLEGERYIGDTPGFSLTAETETVDFWSSDGPIAEREELVATQITRQFQVGCRNMNLANWALFIIGEQASVDQGADSVTAEPLTVSPGLYYQLGRSEERPTGVRHIENFELTDGDTVTYEEGVDYEIDLELGLLRILEGGAIGEDEPTEADWDETEQSWLQAVATDVGAQYGGIHYIADNTAGPNQDVWVPRAIIRPQGEMDIKSREQWQQMTFQCEALKRAGFAQLYIDGRPLSE